MPDDKNDQVITKFAQIPRIFKQSLFEHMAKDPAVKESIKKFRDLKKEIPPKRFKGEHRLNPPLNGFSECHLGGNSAMIYTYKDDTYTLVIVVDHSELKGPKQKNLNDRIKDYRQE